MDTTRSSVRPPSTRLLLLLSSLVLTLLFDSLRLCSSLNDEGNILLKFKETVESDPHNSLANWITSPATDQEDGTPCSWSGVRCHQNRVVSLDLAGLSLKGKLTPELGKLTHLRQLILHSNSFYGLIPREVVEMQKLQLLDLRCNNIMKPLNLNPNDFLYLENLALKCDQFPPAMKHELDTAAKGHRKPFIRAARKLMMRTLMEDVIVYKDFPHASNRSSSTKPNPRNPRNGSATDGYAAEAPGPSVTPAPLPANPVVPTSRDTSTLSPPSTSSKSESRKSKHLLVYILVASGAFMALLVIAFVLYHRFSKAVSVKPWATGLSGQLQRAFVTGVPMLRRVELQTACEDFSNIIGSFKDCILYKGTLSSGVEIAVTSAIVKSANDWTKQAQAKFRKKIEMLSKVNHKNFVNLLGYCEESEPFTRMMVFEYAPNGTLFDHLHVKEAADLNWASRLRIAMGIAYCLEHMHQQNPPVILSNLESSSIYLTDDYAAKIWDLELWSGTTTSDADSGASDPLTDQTPNQASVVYKYGLILLEIISGRLPYPEEHVELQSWASEFLSGSKPLTELIDPELKSYSENDACRICEVIKSCMNSDLNERPSMKEIAGQLREITTVLPEGATPKLSPLWWAELEIITTEVN